MVASWDSIDAQLYRWTMTVSAVYAAMRCLCVCLCVCHFLSCVKTNKDIFKIFHRGAATPFSFFRTKRDGDIPTGTPLTGASNAGGVGRNRDFEPTCLLLKLQQARCCKHGRRWTTATISQVVTRISLVVHCGYSTTKRHAR